MDPLIFAVLLLGLLAALVIGWNWSGQLSENEQQAIYQKVFEDTAPLLMLLEPEATIPPEPALPERDCLVLEDAYAAYPMPIKSDRRRVTQMWRLSREGYLLRDDKRGLYWISAQGMRTIGKL